MSSSKVSNKNNKWFFKLKNDDRIFLFYFENDKPLSNRRKDEFGRVIELREGEKEHELVVSKILKS